MHPIPFDRLMEHIVTEYRQEGSVFGITNFFRADPKRSVSMFGERMETPVGPAAGPHTQLAQNIVSAYLCGARFFELKTVQTLDGEDLPVEKPCILAEDEGYNVEWSTELRVGQALDEYIKAWFALKLLSKEFSLGGEDGFIFNMSVGYDLKGIQSPKIDAFIEGLKDASGTEAWRECQSWALSNAGRFSRVDEDYVRGISPKSARPSPCPRSTAVPRTRLSASPSICSGRKSSTPSSSATRPSWVTTLRELRWIVWDTAIFPSTIPILKATCSFRTRFPCSKGCRRWRPKKTAASASS
jgi:hypothetical protein